MDVRVKFVCVGIRSNPPSKSKIFTFWAVVYGSEENKSFSSSYPSGRLELEITFASPASDAFELGKEYYLNIMPAD